MFKTMKAAEVTMKKQHDELVSHYVKTEKKV